MFTAGDRNRLFTHTNTFPICLEDNPTLLGKHANQVSIPPSREKLAFCTKSGKATALAACRTMVCVSSGIWCFEQQGREDLGLRAPAWSHPPLFCTILIQVICVVLSFLQKMGLVQRRLEASSHFLWACPAFPRPARVWGPKPSFGSENSNPQLRGQ